MTDTATDADLRVALAAASTPEERAAVVGLDWETLRKDGIRISFGAVLISAVAGAVAAQFYFEPRPDDLDFGLLLWGLFAAFSVSIVSLLMVNLTLRLLFGRVSLRREQIIAGITSAVATSVAILGAVMLLPHTQPAMLGLLIGMTVTTILGPLAVATLPSSMRRGTPAITTMILQHRALPAWQTLFGGRARWLLARQAISIVEVAAAVLLLWSAPWAVAIILVLDVVSAWLTAEATARDRRGPWLLVGAGSAVVLVIVALLVA